MKSKLVGVVAALTFLAAVPPTYADNYIYVTLNVPQATSAFASGINNAGHIVGSYSPATGNSGYPIGFLYRNGGMAAV